MLCQLVLITLLRLTVGNDVIEINQQQLINGENELHEQIKANPDVINDYFPNREALKAYSKYRISYPDTEDYKIGLIVNPCGANGTGTGIGNDYYSIPLAYDCCVDRYGSGEYGFLKYHLSYQNGKVAMNTLQIFERRILADPDEIMNNMITVDEHGFEIPYEYSRRADDVTMIDKSCKGLREPHTSCLQERLRAARNPITPSCWDHNQTVDSTLDCYDPDGTKMSNCMQVGFSQNAFIHVCGGKYANDDQCGTYIEIHRDNGSNNDAEEAVIAARHITMRKTNGMRTTAISLTYKGDKDKLLCNYSESKIRIGSIVRINEDSPTCCCPPTYNQSNKRGSFFCPKDTKTGKRGGPFAVRDSNPIEHVQRDLSNDIYPYCHHMDENEDILMCGRRLGWDSHKFDTNTHEYFLGSSDMFYTAPCNILKADDNGIYSSSDLNGGYIRRCPLGEGFKGCGLSQDECIHNDSPYSFSGQIGKVVRLPNHNRGNDPSTPALYGVSFNDGRTVYDFMAHHLSLEQPRSNYELWFVQRNRFEKILQKRKRFRVISPECTFDVVNDQYFPYAQMRPDGSFVKSL